MEDPQRKKKKKRKGAQRTSEDAHDDDETPREEGEKIKKEKKEKKDVADDGTPLEDDEKIKKEKKDKKAKRDKKEKKRKRDEQRLHAPTDGVDAASPASGSAGRSPIGRVSGQTASSVGSDAAPDGAANRASGLTASSHGSDAARASAVAHHEAVVPERPSQVSKPADVDAHVDPVTRASGATAEERVEAVWPSVDPVTRASGATAEEGVEVVRPSVDPVTRASGATAEEGVEVVRPSVEIDDAEQWSNQSEEDENGGGDGENRSVASGSSADRDTAVRDTLKSTATPGTHDDAKEPATTPAGQPTHQVFDMCSDDDPLTENEVVDEDSSEGGPKSPSVHFGPPTVRNFEVVSAEGTPKKTNIGKLVKNMWGAMPTLRKKRKKTPDEGRAEDSEEDDSEEEGEEEEDFSNESAEEFEPPPPQPQQHATETKKTKWGFSASAGSSAPGKNVAQKIGGWMWSKKGSGSRKKNGEATAAHHVAAPPEKQTQNAPLDEGDEGNFAKCFKCHMPVALDPEAMEEHSLVCGTPSPSLKRDKAAHSHDIDDVRLSMINFLAVQEASTSGDEQFAVWLRNEHCSDLSDALYAEKRVELEGYYRSIFLNLHAESTEEQELESG